MRRSMSLRAHHLLLLLCLSACPRTVEDAPVTEIRSEEFVSSALEARLDVAADRARARGFSSEEGVWRGFIVHRGSDVHEVSLQSGACHLFVAAGSEAIEAFDLVVYDSTGSEAARSSGSPAVRICPSQSGVYFVALRTTGSGLFSVRRFQGPSGLDLRLDDLTGEE